MAGTLCVKTRFALLPGHVDVFGHSRISLNVMPGLVPGIHVFL